MSDTLANFPFWKLQFDEQAVPAGDVATAVLEIAGSGLTDLFIFSHGWNNDHATAMALYTGFFGAMRKILDDTNVPKRRAMNAGAAGVIWPSILFPGDTVPCASGGAASFTGGGTLESELPKLFMRVDQQQSLEDVLALLRDRPADDGALLVFRDKLRAVVSEPSSTTSPQDDLEVSGLAADDMQWRQILEAMSAQTASDDTGGGAASFGGPFGRLWDGAKNVLRVTSYWQMKNRAGLVGKYGLGPLVGRIHDAAPDLRIHLLGHSFGARVVSYTLAGLPGGPVGAASPVKSLFLLQGAFSHFAFADALPFDTSRKGDLAGMAARVDGPLLTTHSLLDLAVGNAYPMASILAGQDASAATDVLYRWEGMGHDGAQAVGAAGAPLGPVMTSYPFQPGNWVNLDGNDVIKDGGPPSGAHSDIIHPETAWAALAAAGL